MLKRNILLVLLCLFAAGTSLAVQPVDDSDTIALWHGNAAWYYIWFAIDDFSAGYRVQNLLAVGNPANYADANYIPMHSTDSAVGDANSLQFDGVNDMARTQAQTWVNYRAMAVEVYFKAQKNTGIQTLLEVPGIWSITLNNSNAVFTVNTAGSPRVYTITNAVALNTWQHLTASCNAAGNVSFQVDALAPQGGSGAALAIGTEYIYAANSNGTNFFQGILDEMKISAPGRLIYTDDSTTMALWHFDDYDAAGIRIPDDDSANPGRNAKLGLYYNATSASKWTSPLTPPSAGLWLADPTVAGSGDATDPVIGYPASSPAFGKCMYFDGYGGHAAIPASNIVVDPCNFQVECWMRMPNEFPQPDGSSPALYYTIFNRNNQILWRVLTWHTNNRIQLECHVYSGTDGDTTLTYNMYNSGVTNTEIRQWNHVKLTIEGTTAKMWVNGVAKVTTTLPGYLRPTTTSTFTMIGLFDTGGGVSPFWGYMDEFKITGTPVVYAPAEPAQDDASTLGLWHFDDYTASYGIPDDDMAKPTRNADLALHNSAGTLINYAPTITDGVLLIDPTQAVPGSYEETNPIGYPADNPAFDKCIYFDGYTASARVPATKVPADGNNMQISFWMRLADGFNETPGSNLYYDLVDRWDQMVVRLLNWGNNGGIHRGLVFEVLCFDKGGTNPSIKVYYNSLDDFSYKKWHYWTIKVIGTQVQVLLNGRLQTQYTLPQGLKAFYPLPNMYMGLRSFGNADGYWGYLDDVRIARAIPVCGDLGYSTVDFDKNCIVDFKDLSEVVQDWLKINTLPASNGIANYPAITEAGWADHGNYNIPQASVVPTINGTISAGEWADTRPIEMVYPALNTLPNSGTVVLGNLSAPTNSADYSLFWYAKWDTNYLYVAGVIYDNIVNSVAGQDEPQICFNFQNNFSHLYLTQAFVWNFRTDNTWKTNTPYNGGPLITPSANTMFSRVNSPAGVAGYIIEAKLKWSDLACDNPAYVPSAGDKHGFGFACQDHDTGGTREHFLLDFGKNAFAMTNLATWNTITLVSQMPCYEKQGIYTGDLNVSCKVDLADVADFAQEWFSCNDPSGVTCDM